MKNEIRLCYQLFSESHLAMYDGGCESLARAAALAKIRQLQNGEHVCQYWKDLCKNGHVSLRAYSEVFDSAYGTVIQSIPVEKFISGDFDVLAIWESVKPKPQHTCCPFWPSGCPITGRRNTNAFCKCR